MHDLTSTDRRRPFASICCGLVSIGELSIATVNLHRPNLHSDLHVFFASLSQCAVFAKNGRNGDIIISGRVGRSELVMIIDH